jgi:TolB-like protein/Tfp pilus assembly protein PilF
MGEPSPGIRPPESAPQERLDSWKEIAAYLNRDVTTVQRWERREGMPVHRHLHDKRGSVYALSSELDAWQKSRKIGVEDEPEELPEGVPQKVEDDQRSKIASGVSQRLVIGLAVAVLALLAGAYVRARIRAGSASEPIKSLAVLPLKNLSGDPSQEYLADGMTEALIGRIANIQGLRVVSRTSVMRFKDSKLSLPELAKAVGADAVVEGSVVREGDRIRVSAQLIRASTDMHLFSTIYDRDLQQVLALESDVAQDIARKVEVAVSGPERTRLAAQRTVSPEVYESYLKGRFALNRSQIKTSIEESIGYFEEAIGKDPSFAPAYLGLAQAYQSLGAVYVGEPPEGTRTKMFEAVQRALQLDPESADGHVLLGDYFQASWKWTEAEAEDRRALDLNPNDAQAYNSLAYWSLCQARFEEALQYARHGRQLDPFTVSGTDIGFILFHARRYNESIQEFKAALSVEPDDAFTLWWLGFALIANHQSLEAVSTLERSALLSHGSPGVLGVLVHAYVDAGRREDALRVLAELKGRKNEGFVPAGAFVNAYLGLGDKEAAMNWLEQAYRERSTIVLHVKVHPFFDPLRNDPRFVALQRRVGLG